MGLFLLVLVFNQAQIFSVTSLLEEKTMQYSEASKPALLAVTIINDDACKDCTSVALIPATLKKNGANITSQKSVSHDSVEGKALIAKYGITNVPAIVVTGEINKTDNQGFEVKDNALVYSQKQPPYLDLKQNKVVGRVTLTIINATSCKDCTDVMPLVSNLKGIGVAFEKTIVYDANSQNGKALIQKYALKEVPTVILSGDISVYPQVTQAWPQLGTVETDGMYVMRTVSPPYLDLTDGKVKGLASLIYLNDSTCKDCYDVTEHKIILQQSFGMKFSSVKSVDVSSTEGKALVKKYDITAVPTPLIGSASVYKQLTGAWTQVGSIEKDGTYIFRNFDQWPGHAYKNLTTGKVVPNPSTQ